MEHHLERHRATEEAEQPEGQGDEEGTEGQVTILETTDGGGQKNGVRNELKNNNNKIDLDQKENF